MPLAYWQNVALTFQSFTGYLCKGDVYIKEFIQPFGLVFSNQPICQYAPPLPIEITITGPGTEA